MSRATNTRTESVCLLHPNGRLPAYEWAFGNVSPPVHAWASWRVNRKDPDQLNVFQGGFLGLDNVYELELDGPRHSIRYEPEASTNGMFGGNSNWRGPVWFPVNYLIIESLQRFHHYYGGEFRIECPAESGLVVSHQTGWTTFVAKLIQPRRGVRHER